MLEVGDSSATQLFERMETDDCCVGKEINGDRSCTDHSEIWFCWRQIVFSDRRRLCFVFFLRTLLRKVHRKHVYLGKEEKELPNKPFFLLFVNKNVSYFEERPFLPLLSQSWPLLTLYDAILSLVRDFRVSYSYAGQYDQNYFNSKHVMLF